VLCVSRLRVAGGRADYAVDFLSGCWYSPRVKQRSIAIVGAGRLGIALAERLTAAGYVVSEIVVRGKRSRSAKFRRFGRRIGAQIVDIRKAELSADLVWFCVPDAEIARAAGGLRLANWKGRVAFHSSGVLSSDELRLLRERGAHVASVHPLMTFVAGSVPQLREAPFAIEGDRKAITTARRIIRDLGGVAMMIRKEHKVAYHVFATMVCPLLVSLLAASEKAAGLAGMSSSEARRRLIPILRQTIANYEKLGPAGSFSGPVVRGDAETLRLHLDALSKFPAVKSTYTALARASLEFLPARNQETIAQLLDVFSSPSFTTPRSLQSEASNRRAR